MISNSLTVFRFALSVLVFVLLAYTEVTWIALLLFLAAGALDMLDGPVARTLNEASAIGGLLDLTADRLLTLFVCLGLLMGGRVPELVYVPLMVLCARDLIVASCGEAAIGQAKLNDAIPEAFKIGLSFLGLALLMTGHAPAIGVAVATLWLAALLSLGLVMVYWCRTLRALAP